MVGFINVELTTILNIKPMETSTVKASDFIRSVVEPAVRKHQEGLYTQQSAALEKIVKHYFDSSKDIALVGCAGSGKSYVAQRIIKCINEIKKIKTALVAPTHKATSVLEEFSTEADLRDTTISTVHSALHVIPGRFDEKGNQLLKENKHSLKPHLREFDYAVVDECSMIDPEIYSRVQQTHTQILWLGDSFQLPYVSKLEEDLKLTDIKLSPTFTHCEQVELTEVLRYSGAIAQYANYIRENINLGKLNTPKRGKTGNLHNLTNIDWEEEFIKRLADDPKNVRAICYSNIAVRTLAKKARQVIYGDDADYHVGEIISAKEMVSVKQEVRGRMKDVILMHSCEEGTIEATTEVMARIPNAPLTIPEIPFHQLSISTKTKYFILFTPTSKALKEVVRPYMKKQKDAILAAPKNLRSQMWAEYYEALSLMQLTAKGNTIVERIQYAGVLTINQSQGSGFPVLFMNCRSTYAAKIPALRNRLMYTGVTRAKEELYINLQWDNPYFDTIVTEPEISVSEELYNRGLCQFFYKTNG